MRRPGWPTVFFNPGWIGLSHPYVPYKVVGRHLHRQPGAIGGEAPRGEMVQSHAVLEVSAWRRWSASSSRVSPSRSVMQP